MLKLNTRVKIKETGVEGRVAARTEYINGSVSYSVHYLDGKEPTEIKILARHEEELEIVHELDTTPDPKGRDDLPLGTHVRALPNGEYEGIVTALLYSSTGCVEYEVTGYVPLRGPIRHILDGEVLEVVEEVEPVKVGAMGGSSFAREVTSR